MEVVSADGVLSYVILLVWVPIKQDMIAACGLPHRASTEYDIVCIDCTMLGWLLW